MRMRREGSITRQRPRPMLGRSHLVSRDVRGASRNATSRAAIPVARRRARRSRACRRNARGFARTPLSLPGNTSIRPRRRRRITEAVQGPMPVIRCNSSTASSLYCCSRIASLIAPLTMASAARRSVARLLALSPATRSSASLASRNKAAQPSSDWRQPRDRSSVSMKG